MAKRKAQGAGQAARALTARQEEILQACGMGAMDFLIRRDTGRWPSKLPADWDALDLLRAAIENGVRLNPTARKCAEEHGLTKPILPLAAPVAALVGWLRVGEAAARLVDAAHEAGRDLSEGAALKRVSLACTRGDLESRGNGKVRRISPESLKAWIANVVGLPQDRVRAETIRRLR